MMASSSFRRFTIHDSRFTIPKLLAWYRRHKRDLPWRNTDDPYRIFLSEIMLQQTQVDRVIPFYRAFIRRFPSWSALAKSNTAALLHAWAGLGYNRRALYLREAARQVVARGVPHNEEDWRRLKGVGPYTAAALATFINKQVAVVIDTNVRRVVGRLFLGLPHPEIKHDTRIRRVLSDIQPTTSRERGELPQAFMDLGSAICLPRRPRCEACPLNKDCEAAPRFLSGVRIIKRATKPVERRHRDKPFPDRIYRGRILALVRTKRTVSLPTLGKHIDTDFNPRLDAVWMHAMVERLAKDGMVVIERGTVTLPPT